MYIETSWPRRYGENAKLEFSVWSSDIGKLSCLRFYYHMYGKAVNTLIVYNGDTQVFTEVGNQGNVWLSAKITITLQSNVSSNYLTKGILSVRNAKFKTAYDWLIAVIWSHRKKTKLTLIAQF